MADVLCIRLGAVHHPSRLRGRAPVSLGFPDDVTSTSTERCPGNLPTHLIPTLSQRMWRRALKRKDLGDDYVSGSTVQRVTIS